MKTNYKYISSSDYIDSLSFGHIETFSFQRGADYEIELAHYNRLRTKKNQSTLTEEESDEFLNLSEKLWSIQFLIDEKGQFHPSAVKTNLFGRDDKAVTQLLDILHTEITVIPSWMCAPLYRDAIVFYDDKKKILSCLNVCLSCEYIQLDKNTYINADEKVYSLLRRFFVSCGHEIETINASR